ncbi:MAG TPA: fluoride efflux transporter CrcB [Gemmatimonadales bacterium]|jgi:CrcB protein
MNWYVAFGGAVGSVVRFILATAVQERFGGSFPVGTLLINITGSLLVAFLLEYALATPAISREARALLTTGFCGGYTTFSTFSYETLKLLHDGDYRRAGVYVGLSVVVSLVGAFVGFSLAREVLTLRRLA